MTIPNQKSKIQQGVFVLISLGANLGGRKDNILLAANLFKETGIITNLSVSGLFETEPVGFNDQPWFINAALKGYTDFSMFELIHFCKSIEYFMGRKQRQRWHEREIDIDILLFGDSVIIGDKVSIPHPRMHERRFVLAPAAEIAADTLHPVFQNTIGQLLLDCPDTSEVRKYLL